jgi:P27 family predicted phage terminase small subunit
MKGRKRKPYLVAKQDGFTHHEKRPPCPDASLGDYEPPFELSATAHKEWDRIRVEAPWVLAVNALLLAERCRAFSQLQDACLLVEVGGLVIQGDRRQAVRNPAIVIANALRTFLLRVDAELGLTPCSQSRVNATAGKLAASIEDEMCG